MYGATSIWFSQTRIIFVTVPQIRFKLPEGDDRNWGRRKHVCASELKRNTQSRTKNQQPAINRDQTRSASKKNSYTGIDRILTSLHDLPEELELCGDKTGQLKIPVCHRGFPRVKSPALWMENVCPTEWFLSCECLVISSIPGPLQHPRNEIELLINRPSRGTMSVITQTVAHSRKIGRKKKEKIL